MRLIVIFICGFCRSAPVGVAHVNPGQFSMSGSVRAGHEGNWFLAQR
ncbi:hypothetical protein M2418_001923 [Rhizobium sp. BIGb0125]|nr:hypothetical protein [Rhizobium sp. BIGb0125]